MTTKQNEWTVRRKCMRLHKGSWKYLLLTGTLLVNTLSAGAVYAEAEAQETETEAEAASQEQSAQTENANSAWSLSLMSIQMSKGLETTTTVTLYDGSKENVEYSNQPDEGMVYAIISAQVTKNLTGGEAFDTTGLQLHIGEETYDRLAEDAFLNNHEFTALESQAVTSTYGAVCFQVPEAYFQEETFDGWYLTCGDYRTAPYDAEANTVPYQKSLINQMEDIDNEILTEYQLSGGSTLAEAMIVNDPYGNAPLTAAALFETEEDCSVQVTVKGKTEQGDITYTVEEPGTSHRIGIYGLYPDYENTVEITAGEETQTFRITTEPLPEEITTIRRDEEVSSEETVMDNQLIILQDGWYTMFDQQGDIRWYIDEKWHTTGVSGAFTIDETGEGFWFVSGTTNASPYRNGARMMHMNWFGKLLGVYSYDGYCAHHSADILPNGNLLYLGSNDDDRNTILELNPETGEMEEYLDLNQLSWLDPSVGNLNPSKKDTEWAHPNSVQYVEERDCLLISLRNQHMLINLDFTTKEPNWILTAASAVNENGEITAEQEKAIPYLIMPDEEFEWFYSQHDMLYVSGTDTTMDFTVFDNGSHRYVSSSIDEEKEKGPRYSRMLHLRVDEESRTVSTVYEYGKDEGLNLFSTTFGGAQYIEENGHYLGAFKCKTKKQEDSVVVETDSDGQVAARYFVGKIKEGNYRATALTVDELQFSMDMYSEGVEVHRYAKDSWESQSLPEDGEAEGYSRLRVNTLFTDGETISLYGRAFAGKEFYTQSISLIAKNDQGETFGFPMTVTQLQGGGFYGEGIPLQGLAYGKYELYILSYGKEGQAAVEKLDQVLDYQGQTADLTVTSLVPDQSQERMLEELTSFAMSSTLDEAYTVMNPFGTAPLTAMVAFSTDQLSSVSVLVHGKQEGTNVAYDVEGSRYVHKIPVWGLYYNDTTEVTLSVTDEEGNIATKEFRFTTGESEDGRMPDLKLDYKEEDLDKLQEGLTFCWPAGGCHPVAIDKYGDVRWYYTKQMGAAAPQLTEEGHLLIFNLDKSPISVLDQFSGIEIDLMGRVYQEYYLDGGVHHEYQELPNGNLLFEAYKMGSATFDDYFVEMNPETGEIVRSWKMDEIFGEALPVNPAFEQPDNSDWFHSNSVYYVEEEDALIISSRHQSMVIKISAETSEIQWILSDPEYLEGTELEQYLLTPEDEDFEWQYGQHDAYLTENGDLMLFDNGNYRSKSLEDRVMAVDNYSRALRLRIDEEAKTFTQVWEYGRELGSEYFTNQVGGVETYDDNHYLVNFGDHFRLDLEDGTSVASDVDYTVQMGYVQEVVDDEAIWTVTSTPEAPILCSAFTRANRWNFTSMTYDYDTASERTWVGSGPATALAEAPYEADKITEGQLNMELASVVNEGNRLVINGTVLDKDVKSVSVMLVSKAETRYYNTRLDAETGALSAALYFDNNALPYERQVYFLAEKNSGEIIRYNSGIVLPETEVFSVGVESHIITVGESVETKAVISPVNAVNHEVSYESSDEAIAQVTEDGTVTGISPGTAIVTVTSEETGVRSQFEVLVTE